MNLSRQAPLQHPLAQRFASAVDSLGAALAPQSARLYHGTARNFLTYLGADHPEIISLDQLRRDPHILGWMAKLRSQVPPLAPVTYISRLIFLRGILAELACSAQLPELAQLLRRQDVPRPPRRLPRALTLQQDQLLQQELLRRNDLAAKSSCYSVTPVCASAKRLTFPSTASTPPAPINGQSTCRSAS